MLMLKYVRAVLVPGLILLLSAQLRAEADSTIPNQKIFGAGPSTTIATLFAEHFSQQPEAQGLTFSVPQQSTKHAGGIRSSKVFLFGRTGRPLSDSEKAEGKGEIFLGRIPAGFVTGKGVSLSALSVSQLESIYNGTVTNWSGLEGADQAILRTGREPGEAVYGFLKSELPFMAGVHFDKVFKRDHTLKNFLSSDAGAYALGFGALTNFDPSQWVEIEGHTFGVPLGLVYDLKNADHPVVKAAIEYSRSDEWHALVQQAGLYTVK